MVKLLAQRESIVPKILRLGSSFGRPENLPKPETVVVEYSSVNIGKPIHAGHLRATLFGHCICKINEFMGHKVIGINYIGDWGSQFGKLLYGYERYGNEKALDRSGVKHLYNVYTKVHSNLKGGPLGVDDEQRIAYISNELEQGNEQYLRIWKKIKELSMVNLEQTYERMGISFSEYQFESQFVKKAKNIANDMVMKKLANKKSDGSITCTGFGGQEVTLTTNEGHSLYFSRDIAAAIHRYQQHNFDRMHYIVSDGQSVHFKNLAHVLKNLGYDWLDKCEPWGFHVPFGIIESMSTRRGSSVFLHDLLDQYQEKMINRLKKNTRLQSKAKITKCADELAWSFLVECLLKYPRMRPISRDFYNKDDGVKLQYCHSRLCSLEVVAAENKIRPIWNEECGRKLMTEESTDTFMAALFRFPSVVEQVYSTYEMHHLVLYARDITKGINRALLSHKIVTNKNRAEAETNLALIMAGRQVLRNCFHLLGIPPISVM